MKTAKLDGPQQVAAYLDKLQHPLKREIEVVRTIILGADERLSEHIKWNAPSFCVDGDDRVTFNLHGKGYFMLVFHCGAKAKGKAGKEPLFADDTGLLEWVAGDRATVKFTDMDDVTAKKEKLVSAITKWIAETSMS